MKYAILTLLVLTSFACSGDRITVEEQPAELVNRDAYNCEARHGNVFVFYNCDNPDLCMQVEWVEGAFGALVPVVSECGDGLVADLTAEKRLAKISGLNQAIQSKSDEVEAFALLDELAMQVHLYLQETSSAKDVCTFPTIVPPLIAASNAGHRQLARSQSAFPDPGYNDQRINLPVSNPRDGVLKMEAGVGTTEFYSLVKQSNWDGSATHTYAAPNGPALPCEPIPRSNTFLFDPECTALNFTCVTGVQDATITADFVEAMAQDLIYWTQYVATTLGTVATQTWYRSPTTNEVQIRLEEW